jgi:hypothetical protein
MAMSDETKTHPPLDESELAEMVKRAEQLVPLITTVMRGGVPALEKSISDIDADDLPELLTAACAILSTDAAESMKSERLTQLSANGKWHEAA